MQRGYGARTCAATPRCTPSGAQFASQQPLVHALHPGPPSSMPMNQWPMHPLRVSPIPARPLSSHTPALRGLRPGLDVGQVLRVAHVVAGGAVVAGNHLGGGDGGGGGWESERVGQREGGAGGQDGGVQGTALAQGRFAAKLLMVGALRSTCAHGV